MTDILEAHNLTKTYRSGSRELTVLDDINFSVQERESFAIVGPSGSGKTTLLGLCAGLDSSNSGSVKICGEELTALSEDERAILRNQKVGFIFQSFQLLPALTSLENVMVPMELLGMKNARREAQELLEKVGLADRAQHYPSQLSGGEQQRISMARAFANKPSILFADEPTGNLDQETGERVIDLLFNLNRDAGTTLVIVTHDMELAQKSKRILRLKGGKVVSTESTAVS